MPSKLIGVAFSFSAVLALGACGSTVGSPSRSTIASLTPTNFVVAATFPASSTSTVASAGGGAAGAAGTYTIAAGDYPSTIARKFKVSMSDLLSLNGWTLTGQQVTNFPPVGTVIKIPAGGTQPGTGVPAGGGGVATNTTTTTTPTGDSTAPSGTGAPTTSVAGPTGNCKAGSYTITKADTTRQKVADKLNLTVAQLDAANTSTKGYSSFYPGLKIVVPAKANC